MSADCTGASASNTFKSAHSFCICCSISRTVSSLTVDRFSVVAVEAAAADVAFVGGAMVSFDLVFNLEEISFFIGKVLRQFVE